VGGGAFAFGGGAVAAGREEGRNAGAAVVDGNVHGALIAGVSGGAGAPGRDAHAAAAALFGNAVLDGVFDERLHGEGGRGVSLQRRRQVQLHLQRVAEAHLFDLQVVPHEGEFLFERHERLAARLQNVAEDGGEMLDGRLGALGLHVDERGDGVEGVEQEMRIDLGAQGGQFGAGAGAGEGPFARHQVEAFGRQRELPGQKAQEVQVGPVVERAAFFLAAHGQQPDGFAVPGDGEGQRHAAFFEHLRALFGQGAVADFRVARPHAPFATQVRPHALEVLLREVGRLRVVRPDDPAGGGVVAVAPGVVAGEGPCAVALVVVRVGGCAQKETHRARLEGLAHDGGGLLRERLVGEDGAHLLLEAAERCARALRFGGEKAAGVQTYAARQPLEDRQQKDDEEAHDDVVRHAGGAEVGVDNRVAAHEGEEDRAQNGHVGERAREQPAEGDVAQRGERDQRDRPGREQLHGDDEPAGGGIRHGVEERDDAEHQRGCRKRAQQQEGAAGVAPGAGRGRGRGHAQVDQHEPRCRDDEAAGVKQHRRHERVQHACPKRRGGGDREHDRAQRQQRQVGGKAPPGGDLPGGLLRVADDFVQQKGRKGAPAERSGYGQPIKDLPCRRGRFGQARRLHNEQAHQRAEHPERRGAQQQQRRARAPAAPRQRRDHDEPEQVKKGGEAETPEREAPQVRRKRIQKRRLRRQRDIQALEAPVAEDVERARLARRDGGNGLSERVAVPVGTVAEHVERVAGAEPCLRRRAAGVHVTGHQRAAVLLGPAHPVGAAGGSGRTLAGPLARQPPDRHERQQRRCRQHHPRDVPKALHAGRGNVFRARGSR